MKDCKEHHSALTRGYTSRKASAPFVAYKGRFGEGLTRLTPHPRSTQYCYITYYIKRSD